VTGRWRWRWRAGLLSLSLLHCRRLFFLLRHVVADSAANSRSSDRMMTGNVSADAANRGALEASFSTGCDGHA